MVLNELIAVAASGIVAEMKYVVVPNKRGGGSPGDLKACLDVLLGSAQARVDKVAGEIEAPVRLTFEAAQEVVESLRRQFGDRLIFEQDQPLKLMG